MRKITGQQLRLGLSHRTMQDKLKGSTCSLASVSVT
jgi:hypothetical protein